MNKSTKIIISLAVIVILGALSWYFSYYKGGSILNLNGNSTSTPIRLSKNDEEILNKTWPILEKYLSFAKDHDLAGLASLSYQLSDSCKKAEESESMKKDCEAKMDSVYNVGATLAKDGIANVWSDKKQVILSTDWVEIENDSLSGRFRSIIYFITNENGSTKVLSFKPAQGTFVNKIIKADGKADVMLSKEEIQSKLLEATEDEDMDGIEDYLETCSDPATAKNCVKTDPNKRDSDGNGYWDGVQALFYK